MPTLWDEWLAVRKAKRAGPVTQTALNTLRNEAGKAGITLEAALCECVSRSWISLKASWINQNNRSPPFPASQAEVDRAAAFRTIFGRMTEDTHGSGNIIDITPNSSPGKDGGDDLRRASGQLRQSLPQSVEEWRTDQER
jgi:hypothetical protein